MSIKDRYRNKSWYNSFWAEQPNAFGGPSIDIKDIISIVYNKLYSKGNHSPSAIDIAAGNGRYVSLLQNTGFYVTAVDISETACSIIKNDLNQKLNFVKIICKDFLSMDNLDSQLFNLVFSSGLLEELTNDQQKIAVKKMKEMTMPSGFILLKYCLEIKNRGQQVKDNFVKSQFDIKQWKIIHSIENKDMKKYLKGVDGEDYIRTGLFYAQKIL